MKIPLSRIVVSGNNPRESFDEKEIINLGQNILEHGLIHPILVRPLTDGNYEMVVGERRLRAHMAVGLPEIEADIREMSDYEVQETRLIENIHRADLTDAEKGDGFLTLYKSPECPYEQEKELAEALQLNYETVCHWIVHSNKLSPKLKSLRTVPGNSFTNKHARFLLKYSHSVQDRLADCCIRNKLTSRQLQELTRRYDQNPQVDLEILAAQVLGLPETVAVAVTELTEQQKQKLKEAKVNKPKPVQPKTKNRVRKSPKITGPWKPQKCRPQNLVMPAADLPAPTVTRNYRLLCGDIVEKSAEIEAETVDVIITDPMYGKDHLSDYESLALTAVRVLKPGGSLIVMTGQSYLPEILQVMTKHLNYNWLLSYLTPGGQSVQLWERKVNTFWKPVLWFTKGKYEGRWVGDVAESEPNDNDKTFSPYGQSESGIHDLIKRFVEPGQLVMDPFMGAATTGVAALKLGCNYVGIDSNIEMVKIASARLAGTKHD